MMSQLGGTLLGGHIIDKLNKRTILILSFVASAISYLMVIIGFKIQSGYVMLFSRVIVGLFKNTYTISTAIIAHEEKEEANKIISLGHLGAVMTTSFIIGPVLGGILFKYMKILPCIISALLFVLNIILTLMLIPKDVCVSKIKDDKIAEKKEVEVETFTNNMINLWSRLVSISSLPNVSSLLTIRLLLSLFESACSSRSIIGYYEKRYNIETHILGYISSGSSIISICCDGFLLPFLLARTSFISNSTFIPLLIFCSASLNAVEFFNSNIYVYILITIIPQTVIQSILASKIKAIQLQSIPSDHFGKFLSVLSLLGTGIGILSPLYGLWLWGNFNGVIYRPLVSAAHLVLLSFLCILLPLQNNVEKKEKQS